MTNAEARFNNSLRPRKPEGSLGRTAQDVHLDSHTAPELWLLSTQRQCDIADNLSKLVNVSSIVKVSQALAPLCVTSGVHDEFSLITAFKSVSAACLNWMQPILSFISFQISQCSLPQLTARSRHIKGSTERYLLRRNKTVLRNANVITECAHASRRLIPTEGWGCVSLMIFIWEFLRFGLTH